MGTCSKTIVVTIFLLLVTSISHAALSIDIRYSEQYLGNNFWKYQYVLSNPVENAGFDLYDVTFRFSDSKTGTVSTLASGWKASIGPGVIDIYSDSPGTPPLGTDIGAGISLGGFSFIFNYRPGPLYYDALLANSCQVEVSSGEAIPTPIPVPIALLGSGLLGLAGCRRRMLK